MPSQSRLTDLWTGKCCCHSHPNCVEMTGYIIRASEDGISGNLGQARLTDITIGSCGHVGRIVTSSSSAFLNNLGKARIGDQVTGCNIGKVITGNNTHEVGG